MIVSQLNYQNGNMVQFGICDHSVIIPNQTVKLSVARVMPRTVFLITICLFIYGV